MSRVSKRRKASQPRPEQSAAKAEAKPSSIPPAPSADAHAVITNPGPTRRLDTFEPVDPRTSAPLWRQMFTRHRNVSVSQTQLAIALAAGCEFVRWA